MRTRHNPNPMPKITRTKQMRGQTKNHTQNSQEDVFDHIHTDAQKAGLPNRYWVNNDWCTYYDFECYPCVSSDCLPILGPFCAIVRLSLLLLRDPLAPGVDCPAIPAIKVKRICARVDSSGSYEQVEDLVAVVQVYFMKNKIVGTSNSAIMRVKCRFRRISAHPTTASWRYQMGSHQTKWWLSHAQ